jgi:hypothetical protein
MSAVWIMVVMFCPGCSDGPARCRTEIVPGSFPAQQRCKEVGGLLKHKGVSYVCLPQWEKAASSRAAISQSIAT